MHISSLVRLPLIAILALLVVLPGCHKQGPAERAGERIDEIGDNIKEGEPPLKRKGTMEKAGEAVDDALSGE